MKLIAITGGIGSGKSVVSRVLRLMGKPVYDTDCQAKRLMSESTSLRQQLIALFGQEVFDGEKLDRKYLSSRVFDNPTALGQLNRIVHPAVKSDFINWARLQPSDIVFMETALLYESGLNQVVDCIWKVTAPEELRIRRVLARSGLQEKECRQRMQAQVKEMQSNEKDMIIVNDGVRAVIPQVVHLLGLLN